MAQAYRRLARAPGFGLHVAVLAISTATFYAFLSGAPLVLGALGVGPGRVGFFIMCTPLSYIVGNALTARLARRVGNPTLMAWGQAVTLLSLVLLLALGLWGPRHPLAFALPLTLLGLGQGLFVPVVLAGTVGLVPALAGAAAGAAGLAQQLLGAAGGYAVGWLPQGAGPGPGLGQAALASLMLALAVPGALAQWRLHRAHTVVP
jgi:DHA1 family bicyclomycin/chloramphenicol resistance-like MFS transporter